MTLPGRLPLLCGWLVRIVALICRFRGWATTKLHRVKQALLAGRISDVSLAAGRVQPTLQQLDGVQRFCQTLFLLLGMGRKPHNFGTQFGHQAPILFY